MINYNQLTHAHVYLRDVKVGRIFKEHNLYHFEYEESWIKEAKGGIALSLPIQNSPYVSEKLFSFFDNLIPEGWLLSHAQNVHKIDKKNRFAILLATGRQTIGAVSVVALTQDGSEIQNNFETKQNKFKEYDAVFHPANDRCPYCLKKLTASQLKKTFFHQSCAIKMWSTTRKIKAQLDASNPLNSFRQTVYGASISGAQRKGLFTFAKGKLIPSYINADYILKPQGDYEFLPENEHVTMAIAKEVGFDLPPFTIFNTQELGMVFTIKRFDLDESGQKLRLEDFCQILDLPSEDKYEKSYNKIGRAIRKYSDAPRADLLELWKRCLFSFFIGNADMHLKNWSLIELEAKNGIFRLSPCYDFLNTRLPLNDEPIDLGLALFGKKNKVSKQLFIEFAQELEIEELAQQVFEKIEYWWEVTQDFVASSYLPQKQKERYLKIVESRYQVLTKNTKTYL